MISIRGRWPSCSRGVFPSRGRYDAAHEDCLPSPNLRCATVAVIVWAARASVTVEGVAAAVGAEAIGVRGPCRRGEYDDAFHYCRPRKRSLPVKIQVIARALLRCVKISE